MKRFLLLMLILSSTIAAMAGGDNYDKRVYISKSGDSLNYRLLTPETLDSTQNYPLVIFMHGSGERGQDNQKQLTHGSEMFLNPVNRERYPAYVIFPQCPEDQFWGYNPDHLSSYDFRSMPDSEEVALNISLVKELIDSYVELPNVDAQRIYIIGLSMGAMGLFDIVIRYPELFAAAVPICGAVRTERLSSVNGVNFRIFHGDSDDVVPVDGSRAAYRTLKEHGLEVEYIEFPGCNHSSWNLAFSYPDFMEWIFNQVR